MHRRELLEKGSFVRKGEGRRLKRSVSGFVFKFPAVFGWYPFEHFGWIGQ
jgi:hypothetical protein